MCTSLTSFQVMLTLLWSEGHTWRTSDLGESSFRMKAVISLCLPWLYHLPLTVQEFLNVSLPLGMVIMLASLHQEVFMSLLCNRCSSLLPQHAIYRFWVEHLHNDFHYIQIKTPYNLVLHFLCLWVCLFPPRSVIFTGEKWPLRWHFCVCACMCGQGWNVCDSEKYYLILHIWKIIKVNVFIIQTKKAW